MDIVSGTKLCLILQLAGSLSTPLLQGLVHTHYNRDVFAPLSPSKTSRLSGTTWSEREMKKWHILKQLKSTNTWASASLTVFIVALLLTVNRASSHCNRHRWSLPNAAGLTNCTQESYEYYTFCLTQILAPWGLLEFHNNWPHVHPFLISGMIFFYCMTDNDLFRKVFHVHFLISHATWEMIISANQRNLQIPIAK